MIFCVLYRVCCYFIHASVHISFIQKYFYECYRATQLIAANLPAMKELTMELVEVVFVPKMIAKQLALAVALQTGMVRI